MKPLFVLLPLLLAVPTASLNAQAADDDLLDLMFRGIDKRSYVDDTSLWNIREIPVCWENYPEVSANDRRLVEQAVQETWASSSCLSFTGWGPCAPDTKGIHIRVSDEGPHVKQIGRRLDGLRDGLVLNVAYGTWSPSCAANELTRVRCTYSIAVHEFGHALGFAHEHNRPDTPGECLEPPQGSDGTIMLTPWDRYSVMNYCNPDYNNDGKLSFWDIYSVRHFYCAPGGQLGD